MAPHRSSGVAHARGKNAETFVVNYLLHHGYRIIATNARLQHFELDIIAQIGPVVAIVEVRYRGPSAWQSPLQSISTAKQNHLRRAAELLWQQSYASDLTVERVRIDVAAVQMTDHGLHIDYIENAIDANYQG